MPATDASVTVLLRAWAGGDRAAFDRVTPVIYAELRRPAGACLRRERPDHRDGIVDEHDLDRGLGHGVALLRDKAAGHLGAHAWEGSPHLFQALDESRDGLVTRAQIYLAPQHGLPAHHRGCGVMLFEDPAR